MTVIKLFPMTSYNAVCWVAGARWQQGPVKREASERGLSAGGERGALSLPRRGSPAC